MVYDGASLRKRSQSNIERLNSELSQSKQRHTELGNDLTQARQEKAALQASFDRTTGRVGELQENSIRLEAKVTRIEKDLADELVRSSQLRDSLDEANALVKTRTLELDESRGRSADLQGDIDNRRARNIVQKDMIDARTRAITGRSRNLVAREVAAMPLESIPWIGIATIATVTALELKDLCDTSKDMRAIRDLFDLSETENDGATEICGAEIWTAEELIAWVFGDVSQRCNRYENVGMPRPEDCPVVSALPLVPNDTGPPNTIHDPDPLPFITDNITSKPKADAKGHLPPMQ